MSLTHPVHKILGKMNHRLNIIQILCLSHHQMRSFVMSFTSGPSAQKAHKKYLLTEQSNVKKS